MIIDLTLPLDSSKRLGDGGDWDSPYSWPVRREFSRILHRPRPHVGIVYTERFLNSRPLTYFDDETKIIRAKAGALLKQVHTPLPKPSKLLRPYETLDSYTSHQLIPYGVPQHVYHQSYFSEPAHLTIGRGHLACIQYAGGKGYPRRKHLYSDENRNIRDEIKFRSYYNRPKNQDPNTLPTGFAWRLLHLPPKDNKPFKIYKHSRTLPLMDSSKPDKEKVESKEIEEKPSYRRYQKTLTEPVEDVPQIEKRKITSYSTENDNQMNGSMDKYNKEERKLTLEETPQKEPKKDTENFSFDNQFNEKPKMDDSVTLHPVADETKSNKVEKTRSKRALNKPKSFASLDDDIITEKTENILTPPKPSEEVILDEEKKDIPHPETAQVAEEVKYSMEQKEEPLPEETNITTEEISEVTQVERCPEEVEMPTEEESIEELKKEEESSVDQELVSTEPVISSSEIIDVVEEKESKPREEQIDVEISEDFPKQEISKENVETLDNPPELLEPLEESSINQNTEVDKSDIDTEQPDEPKVIDTVSNDLQTEESILDNQEAIIEDNDKIDDEHQGKIENSIQEEESNVIVEFNDTDIQNRCDTDETGVTISQIQDESGVTIAMIQDEVTEISMNERNETSETVYSREETVIHAISSTTTQYSEALGDSDKPESFKDIVNETDVTTDEENLENPLE